MYLFVAHGKILDPIDGDRGSSIIGIADMIPRLEVDLIDQARQPVPGTGPDGDDNAFIERLGLGAWDDDFTGLRWGRG
jgi:hypothetical protein